MSVDIIIISMEVARNSVEESKVGRMADRRLFLKAPELLSSSLGGGTDINQWGRPSVGSWGHVCESRKVIGGHDWIADRRTG